MDHDDTYRTEHGLAWLMSALAILLGVIGALEAFAIINLGDAIGATGATPTPSGDSDTFQDGALILLPAIVAAFLAFTLHRSEHHVARHDRTADRRTAATTGNDAEDRRREEGLWTAEHGGAYAATLAAIAFSIIGVLVGFNVLDNSHSFYDGLTWQLLSVLSSVLAATLHSVGHHQPAYEADDIRLRVEERVVTNPGSTATPEARRGVERR